MPPLIHHDSITVAKRPRSLRRWRAERERLRDARVVEAFPLFSLRATAALSPLSRGCRRRPASGAEAAQQQAQQAQQEPLCAAA
ncbi:unnamed protein product [Lampetra planeri]